MKYLDFYYKCLETGLIVDKGQLSLGLCAALPRSFQKTFYPTVDEEDTLLKEGFCPVYWASGLPLYHKDETCVFTPLRQTIVLLMAAMNNEL